MVVVFVSLVWFASEDKFVQCFLYFIVFLFIVFFDFVGVFVCGVQLVGVFVERLFIFSYFFALLIVTFI